MSNVKGRADTSSKKRAMVERLLAAWEQTTDMRLGQLLENASGDKDLFYLEDDELTDKVEAYAYWCVNK